MLGRAKRRGDVPQRASRRYGLLLDADRGNYDTTHPKKQQALFGYTLWEMVQNFGYCQREDGTCEVYHYGQKWSGPREAARLVPRRA